MGGQTELSGPDLRGGIDASSLDPGKTLLGHADGESVLLARVGDDYLAISSSCTHYGGPLGEGLVDGENVRCPWHHACFSLRTGEALRAPALNPVAIWTVEHRGSQVVVTGKVERDPLAPSYPARASASPPERVVIVGAGAAGSAAAEMLRRCGWTGTLTMIDDDSGAPYDRPNLSKDYLAGNAPEEWIPLRPVGFYEQHDMHFLRTRVTGIDTAAKHITLGTGEAVPYDALLLATGAEPVHLGTPGDNLPHVRYLRTLMNSRALIDAAKSARQAVIIGSSFIGLEVAASLRARGVSVHVVAPEAVPLARVVGDDLGNFVRALHEEHGVVFHLGHTAKRIEAAAVILDDDTRLDADLVVIGVGVRPRLELATQAGLAIDRGVIVNAELETSVPGIFAAGDIARWPDPHTGDSIRVEHWVVAQRQGQTAARNILGAGEAYDQVPFFWSAHYDVTINYSGHAEKWDSVEVDGNVSKRDAAVRFIKGRKAVALAAVARDKESLQWEIDEERSVRATAT